MLGVGIDVSKDELVVVVHGEEAVHRFSNDRRGIGKLLRWLKGLKPSTVVLEASGGYETEALLRLTEASIAVARINGEQGKAFARAHNYRAKTDPIDASVLAHFAAVMPVTLFKAPSPELQRLNALSRQRHDVVIMLASQRCRLKQQKDSAALRSIRTLIRALEKETRRLAVELEHQLDSVPDFALKASLLSSLGGFRAINAANLIAALPELGTLSRPQAAALAGVAPFNRDSGLQSRKRSIRGGRTLARLPLYMASVTLVRRNPTFKAFYERLLVRGKQKKVALTACMRKLVVIINAMFRDQRPWQPLPATGS